MVTVGDTIEVEVTSVRVFGLFCRHADLEVLVLIPETSWVASFNSCEQIAVPGDRWVVRVLHQDPRSGQVAASIKACHPNPWVLGLLEPGQRHRARVVRWVIQADRCRNGSAWLLELVPGALVMLCGNTRSFMPGEFVDVVVRSSNEFLGAVEVALADEEFLDDRS